MELKKRNDTRLSIKGLLASKQFDKLLMILIEQERLGLRKTHDPLFGQFAILYDLMPQIVFNTILIKKKEMHIYFNKFVHTKKNVPEDEKVTLVRAHYYLERTKTHYLVNKDHKLALLD